MNIRMPFLVGTAALVTVCLLWVRGQGQDSKDLPPQHTRETLKIGNLVREYILYVPSLYDSTKPTPLVIMLHGFGGTALSAAKETQWSSLATRESFIVAYPEATRPDRTKPQSFRQNPQAWNDGSGRFEAAVKDVDDVGFIRAMIDRISEKWNIDANRTFGTGFSNGASMTFRLGDELSHRLAAIAPVSGTCWSEKPTPSEAMSLYYLTGTADTLNPLEGGYPKLAFGGRDQGGRVKPPVQQFIDLWVAALGCPKNPASDENLQGVRSRVYGPSQRGSEVILVTVDDLGHHWPGGKSQVPNLLVGKPSNRLDGTEAIWAFFKSHPKKLDR